MFKLIRRIIEVAVILAIGAFGYWLWLHPEALRPAAKLYKEGEAKVKEVLNAGEEQRKIIGETTGRATRIYTGDAFQLTDAAGAAFNWRLSGIVAPAIPQQRTPAMQRTAGDVSREFLASLVQSNTVRVAILHQAGLQASDGIAFVGTNNLNLAMVAAGMAEFNPRVAHVLPLDIRNALERAELQARAARLGIWQTDGLTPGRP
jgi:endonuclease YncB( thermonuclease family)